MKERRFLAEILLGFITRDYRRVAEVHFEAGYVPGHHSVENFAQAIRAIGEPIHNRTAEEISMAKLLTLLLEVTGLFDMQTRPELILLQKTMVVVEGVARGFDPKLDIWKVADPVVREWIERNLGPLGRIQGAMSGAGELGRVMSGLPAIASRAVAVLENMEKMTREGLTLSPETIAAMGRAEGRKSRWRTVALWIIAAPLSEFWSLSGSYDCNDSTYLIALIASLAGGRHGQPDHPKTRRSHQSPICGSARPGTAARSKRKSGSSSAS